MTTGQDEFSWEDVGTGGDKHLLVGMAEHVFDPPDRPCGFRLVNEAKSVLMRAAWWTPGLQDDVLIGTVRLPPTPGRTQTERHREGQRIFQAREGLTTQWSETRASAIALALDECWTVLDPLGLDVYAVLDVVGYGPNTEFGFVPRLYVTPEGWAEVYMGELERKEMAVILGRFSPATGKLSERLLRLPELKAMVPRQLFEGRFPSAGAAIRTLRDTMGLLLLAAEAESERIRFLTDYARNKHARGGKP